MDNFLLIPGFLAILAAFIIKLDYAVLTFFALLLPINWLMKLKLGPFRALDIAAILIPLMFFIRLTFFSGKNVLRELNKDLTLQLFYIMLLLLFLSGMMPIREVEIDYFEAIQEWAKFATGFIVFFTIATTITDTKKADRLLSIIPVSLYLPISFFFFQIATGDLIRIHQGATFVPNAYFHNPHLITYGVAMILPVVYYKIIMASRAFNKYMWMSLFCTMLVVAYLSYARTGWIGVIAEIAAIVFLSKRKMLALIIGFIGGFLLFFFFFETIAAKLGDIVVFFINFFDAFETDKFDYLFAGRWRIFRRNLVGFYSGNPIHILIGYGVGGTAFLTTGASRGAGHSTYITLLCDFGLINLCVFFTLMGSLIYKSCRLIKLKNLHLQTIGKTCFITITGYLAIGLGTHFIYALSSGVWLFWGICGIMVGVSSNVSEIEASSA